MIPVTDESSGTGLGYVRLLLNERQKQLRALDELAPDYRTDYLSCRRSLEQAINDLEALERHVREGQKRLRNASTVCD